MSRVLVVEDDPDLLMLITVLLERRRHTVISASAPLEALRLASDFDVVVTDFQLPTMTGLELISRLRAKRRQLPAVLATADTALAGEADARGVVYVLKPFLVDDICNAITQAITNQGETK